MPTVRDITHALSFDIEDWFHIVEVKAVEDPSQWPALSAQSSLVERYTDLILKICDDHKARGTFFMLGWIAAKHPALVKRIADAGHELATHSFWHRKVYELTPEVFDQDIKESIAAITRKLSGPAGGLDCLSCHGIGPKGATKVFEAPAPNFKLVRDRLKKDYYDRWVREPLRLEPGTKMPQFIKDGRTQLTEILDGDGVKQADALWQYLLEGAKIRPPGE